MLHALGMFVASAGRLAPRQLRRSWRPEFAHDQFQIARVGGRLQRSDNLMVCSERSDRHSPHNAADHILATLTFAGWEGMVAPGLGWRVGPGH